MHHVAETLKGSVYAAVGGSWLAFATDSRILGMGSVAVSVGGALGVWWLTRKVEIAEADRAIRRDEIEEKRHQQLLDVTQTLRVNDIRVANMIAEALQLLGEKK
jgi:hypothetical protein